MFLIRSGLKQLVEWDRWMPQRGTRAVVVSVRIVWEQRSCVLPWMWRTQGWRVGSVISGIHWLHALPFSQVSVSPQWRTAAVQGPGPEVGQIAVLPTLAPVSPTLDFWLARWGQVAAVCRDLRYVAALMIEPQRRAPPGGISGPS